MIEASLRPIYQTILVDPIAKILARHTALSPTILTLAALFSGLISAVLLCLNQPITAVLCLLLSGYLDTLDGSLARVGSMSSDTGAVLDIMGDRIVECAIILALYIHVQTVPPEIRGLAILVMLISTLLCITSFLLVAVFTKNTGHKSFDYSPGLIERAEAFIFFILMMLIPAWFLTLAWVYSALVLYTTAYRLYEFRATTQPFSPKRQ